MGRAGRSGLNLLAPGLTGLRASGLARLRASGLLGHPARLLQSLGVGRLAGRLLVRLLLGRLPVR